MDTKVTDFAAYFDFNGRGDRFMTIKANSLEEAVEQAKASVKSGDGKIEIGPLGHMKGAPMLGMGDSLHVNSTKVKLGYGTSMGKLIFWEV